MWPDRVSNPGPVTYEIGALPTALRGPAKNNWQEDQLFYHYFYFYLFIFFLHSCTLCYYLFRWPVLFCDSSALCKWTELSGNCLFYEIKCSRLAFM